MLKKIGTLALLYGFFLSSASFAPVEEGTIAKNSYGERRISALSAGENQETLSKDIESYGSEDFAGYNNCVTTMRQNHPGVLTAYIISLCENMYRTSALQDDQDTVEVLAESAGETATAL